MSDNFYNMAATSRGSFGAGASLPVMQGPATGAASGSGTASGTGTAGDADLDFDLDKVYRDVMSSVTSVTGAAIIRHCEQIRAAVERYKIAFDSYFTYKQKRILTECSDHGLPIDAAVL